MASPKPNVIVCAANWTSDGRVFLGLRHHDRHMNQALIWGDAEFDYTEQGFVDNYGMLHDRRAAWKIAEAAGQIKYRCGGDDANGGTLYSENLY